MRTHGLWYDVVGWLRSLATSFYHWILFLDHELCLFCNEKGPEEPGEGAASGGEGGECAAVAEAGAGEGDEGAGAGA